MSVVYDGDIPGFSGVHYGSDGLGVPGWACPPAGPGDAAASLIRAALNGVVSPLVEYRLAFESPIPAGVIVNENGSGSLTAPAFFSGSARLFADGVEL
jgi:hypothetical protein